MLLLLLLVLPWDVVAISQLRGTTQSLPVIIAKGENVSAAALGLVNACAQFKNAIIQSDVHVPSLSTPSSDSLWNLPQLLSEKRSELCYVTDFLNSIDKELCQSDTSRLEKVSDRRIRMSSDEGARLHSRSRSHIASFVPAADRAAPLSSGLSVSDSELAALTDIFNAYPDLPWFDTPDPCLDGWQGIECSCTSIIASDGQNCVVEVMDLRNMLLEGHVSSAFFQLPMLKYLDLAFNFLSDTLPSELGQLVHLEYLDLGYMYLSGTLPSELYQLVNLKTFGIDQDYFSGSIPSEIGLLVNLEFYFIAWNSFSGTIPTELGQLTRLTNLGLQLNYFSGPIPTELGLLVKLDRLQFFGNDCTGSIPSELGQLEAIQYLDFGRSYFTGSLPLELGQLTTLTNFVCSDAHFSGSLEVLWSLNQLQNLEVNDNMFSGVISNRITALTELFKFNIQGNDMLVTHFPFWLELPLSVFNVDQSLLGENWGNICQTKFLTDLTVNGLNATCYPACAAAMLGESVRASMSRCLGEEDRALCGLMQSSNVVEAFPTVLNGATQLWESEHPYNGCNGFTEKNGTDVSVPNAVSYVIDVSPLSSLREIIFRFQYFDYPQKIHTMYLEEGVQTVPGANVWFGCKTVISERSWGYYFTFTPQYSRTGWACSSDESYAGQICSVTEDGVDWSGVSCSPRGEVIGLDLSSYNIQGSIPSDVFTLSALKSLDLQANAFTGSLPSELSLSLTSLDLSFNKLKGSIPESLGEYTGLKVLSLSNNQLSGPIPLSLASLTASTSLSFAGNQLTGKVPAELCVLANNSVVFDLSSNQLSCYESCWEDVSEEYRKFGTISVCSPTSQPSSAPTSQPTTQPSSSPTSEPVHKSIVVMVVVPVVVGCAVLAVLLYWYVTRYRRAKMAILSNLPVHLMLESADASTLSVSEILEVAETCLPTLCMKDIEGRTVLDLVMARGDKALIQGIVELTLPVDPETKKTVEESNHGYFWVTLIQHEEMASVVETILDRNMGVCEELSASEDRLGRTALNIASPSCRRAIELSRYLSKRYEVETRAVHVSATCRVHLAVDHSDGDRQVALKFMKSKQLFLHEHWIRSSFGLSDQYVVVGLRSENGEDNERFGEELARRGFSTHPYMLVMPAADKNLSQIISTERVASENWTQIHFITKLLCQAVEHMHKCGLIHGDIKPSNIVRTDSTFKLIDFDASSRIGVDYTGVKYSTAYVPPELLLEIGNGGGSIAGSVVGSGVGSAVGSGVGSVVGSEVGSEVDSEVDNRSEGARSGQGSEVLRRRKRVVRVVVVRSPGLDLIENESSLVISDGSHDIWSLGVVLYELFSGSKLFLSNFEDNMNQQDLPQLLDFTDDLKEDKLEIIGDKVARNLVSQMLTKDPKRRPKISQVLAHPFVSGMKTARMVGEEAEFDVFLSYRVASDSDNVERVYKALRAAGLKVWWDKKCLQPGVSWEEGFCDGLVKSRVFIPLLSRGAINHPTLDSQSFTRKAEDSPCDNVLLEHALALELQCRGLVEKIYPLMLGDLVEVDVPVPVPAGSAAAGGTGAQTMKVKKYEHYFATGCHPRFNGEVVVKSVQQKLREHLSRQCLGSAILEEMSVKRVLDSITINQGKIIEGVVDEAWRDVVCDVEKMVCDMDNVKVKG